MKLKKVVILIVMMLFISSCFPNHPGSISQKVETNENEEIVMRNSPKYLIGLASFREFDSSLTSKTTNESINLSTKTKVFNHLDDEVRDYLEVSYHFDYVKIHAATKFDLYISEDSSSADLEDLKLATGLRDLEVIVADFSTYVIDHEDDDLDENPDEILPSITDTLISFRSSTGFYNILTNSYALGNENNYENNHQYWLFSSHKIITTSQVEKDFEPPIYCILLEISDDDQYYLSFIKDEQITSLREFFDYKSVTQFSIDTSTLKQVSRETLYSLMELNSFPESELIVQICVIDINSKVIEVISDTNLSIIYLDEFTEFNNETIELNELMNLLSVNSFIKVSYDYFEGYDPISVYANSISNVDIDQEGI